MHVLHQKNVCQFGRKICDCFIAFGMTAARKQQPSCFAATRRGGSKGLQSGYNHRHGQKQRQKCSFHVPVRLHNSRPGKRLFFFFTLRANFACKMCLSKFRVRNYALLLLLLVNVFTCRRKITIKITRTMIRVFRGQRTLVRGLS